jgi:hypothetical protein
MNLIHPPTEAEALEILQLGTGRPPQKAAPIEPKKRSKPKDYKRPSVTPSLEKTFTESAPKGQRSERIFANAGRSKGVGMTADAPVLRQVRTVARTISTETNISGRGYVDPS